MIHSPPASLFASVRQHFDNPRIKETTLVTVDTDANGAEPVRLTAAEAYEALYGPDAAPQLSAEIWKAVLGTALDQPDPHGTGKLLVIWLALPRLTRTVRRICDRLRADQSDVEAEMVVALLEELTPPDATSRSSVEPLIKAARTRAWAFARAGLRERPSTLVEDIAQDRALIMAGETADVPATREGWEVQVDRPDGPDGLRAPLRFRVHPEHLRGYAVTDIVHGTGARKTGHGSRKARSRRRVGTVPMRRAARRP
ncbi:hypothetical protein CU044_7536 [Streptomyces sp. L-9-10]|uniref:hypothetical protein n=1 Tax=Streptomyces sp. L-9-10 TaxID=1478131 RepID=UPI00101BFF02|nr:hypothetical protein [Streptomyces sp. L-9-10]RYJ19689.1 hypothetical protein CU044_7536 [Streptomyces sp. L-9-10]